MRKPSSGGIPAAIVKRLRTRSLRRRRPARARRADARRRRALPARVPGRGRARRGALLALALADRPPPAGRRGGRGGAVAGPVRGGGPEPALPVPRRRRLPARRRRRAARPADALAYLHANLDPETDQYEAAADIGEQLPALGGQLADRALGLVAGAGGEPLDFDADVEPWFGGEAAVAVLRRHRAAPERVELLEVADADGAPRVRRLARRRRGPDLGVRGGRGERRSARRGHRRRSAGSW